VNNVNGKEEGARGVAVDEENNIYVTGYRQNTTDQYPDDFLTQKFSGQDGSLLWEFVYNREGSTDEANTICLFDVNDVFVSGRSHTWTTWYDIVTINYSDTLHTDIASLSVNEQGYDIRNFPNPFTSQTTISFTLPEFAAHCTIEVSNILGQKIKAFETKNVQPGEHSFVWQKENMTGVSANTGVYFCKLFVDGKCYAVGKLVSAR
jgi:hypothetical protein